MTSQVLTPNTEAAILTRILASDSRQLTPGAARYLLAIKLHISDEDRVNDLSAKSRGVDH